MDLAYINHHCYRLLMKFVYQLRDTGAVAKKQVAGEPQNTTR